MRFSIIANWILLVLNQCQLLIISNCPSIGKHRVSFIVLALMGRTMKLLKCACDSNTAAQALTPSEKETEMLICTQLAVQNIIAKNGYISVYASSAQLAVCTDQHIVPPKAQTPNHERARDGGLLLITAEQGIISLKQYRGT